MYKHVHVLNLADAEHTPKRTQAPHPIASCGIPQDCATVLVCSRAPSSLSQICNHVRACMILSATTCSFSFGAPLPIKSLFNLCIRSTSVLAE